jgi:uncharacterized protein YndB with AHSA1/START domain
MQTTNKTTYNRDLVKKQIKAVREFDAPIDQVWKAWTDSSLLDQWWAPKPWKARTKSMDFKPGGTWLYSMNGPGNESHCARMDFETIDPQKGYTAIDSFCDEKGLRKRDMPAMRWNTQFTSTEGGTRVTVLITFNNEAELEQIVATGFKEGFAMAHDNLDELLQNKRSGIR